MIQIQLGITGVRGGVGVGGVIQVDCLEEVLGQVGLVLVLLRVMLWKGFDLEFG